MLAWPNAPTGNTVSLTLTSNLSANCRLGWSASFAQGTTFPLGTVVPATSITKGVCSYSYSGIPAHPQDGSPINDSTYPGSVSGTLAWDVNVDIGSTITYPNLNLLVYFAPTIQHYTIMTIGVGGNGGADPPPSSRG